MQHSSLESSFDSSDFEARLTRVLAQATGDHCLPVELQREADRLAGQLGVLTSADPDGWPVGVESVGFGL